MNFELEYDDGGVSPLNVQQRNDFYNQMKCSVWKIFLYVAKRKNDEEEEIDRIYTGVCVLNGNFILTTCLDKNDKINNIRACSSEGISYTPIALYRDEDLGLSLLELEVKSKYVKIGHTTSSEVGSSLYALAYGPKSSSPMLFIGECALPFHYHSESVFRMTSNDMYPEYVPRHLGEHTYLIQVDNLYCANIGSAPFKSIGIESGIGSPVFNSFGHLVGIVSFQVINWNMVIPFDYIKRFIDKYTNQGSTSKKRKEKAKKKTKSSR